MDEESRLNAALERADEMVVSSLRKQESERRRLRGFLLAAAVVVSFGGGMMVGAMGMRWWGTRPSQADTAVNHAEAPRVFVASVETPTTGPCEVKWGNQWMPGTIVDRDQDFFLIKYDRWSDFFNEWVTPDRIRPPGSKVDRIGFARPTPHGKKPTIGMTRSNP